MRVDWGQEVKGESMQGCHRRWKNGGSGIGKSRFHDKGCIIEPRASHFNHGCHIRIFCSFSQ